MLKQTDSHYPHESYFSEICFKTAAPVFKATQWLHYPFKYICECLLNLPWNGAIFLFYHRDKEKKDFLSALIWCHDLQGLIYNGRQSEKRQDDKLRTLYILPR